MRTPKDLQAFMDDHDIPGEIVFLDIPTPTVETAALAAGTIPEHIVKSVLFTIRDVRVLAIASGTQLIERRCIAAHFGVGRKRVRLATAEIVLDVTGYPVGTVPPFGHKDHIRTLMDPLVLEITDAYAGGGAHNALVHIDPQDILRITQSEVIDLHNRPA